MTPDETAALQIAQLDMDEAELAVRTDLRAAAARRLYCAAADLDVTTARRVRNYLARLAAELDAVGDVEAAGVVDAAARYAVAVQASAYGLRRLDEIGLSLADV